MKVVYLTTKLGFEEKHYVVLFFAILHDTRIIYLLGDFSASIYRAGGSVYESSYPCYEQIENWVVHGQGL